MSYNKTFNHLSMSGRIWILTKSPRRVHLPYLIGMIKVCLVRRMRLVLNLRMLRRINLRMRFILNLLFLNMQLVHTFRIPHLQGIVRIIPHVLRVSYLLEKGAGIPHLGKQKMKVPRSEGVSIEEFLEEPSSYQEAIDWPCHKEWMDAMRDGIDLMARNKV